MARHSRLIIIEDRRSSVRDKKKKKSGNAKIVAGSNCQTAKAIYTISVIQEKELYVIVIAIHYRCLNGTSNRGNGGRVHKVRNDENNEDVSRIWCTDLLERLKKKASRLRLDIPCEDIRIGPHRFEYRWLRVWQAESKLVGERRDEVLLRVQIGVLGKSKEKCATEAVFFFETLCDVLCDVLPF